MILFAQNIYILMLMKAIGQLLKTQKITVKHVIKKSTKGGKRIGSGRKKADYETKTIAFRVRVEFVEPIKKMVKDYVSERLKGDA
jgi:hypothetical protein